MMSNSDLNLARVEEKVKNRSLCKTLMVGLCALGPKGSDRQIPLYEANCRAPSKNLFIPQYVGIDV